MDDEFLMIAVTIGKWRELGMKNKSQAKAPGCEGEKQFFEIYSWGCG